MADARCRSCAAEVAEGVTLCDGVCRTQVLLALEFVPVYFRNLVRRKRVTVGSRPVPGSRAPRGPVSADEDEDPVDRALAATVSAVNEWVLELHADRGVPACVTDTEVDDVAAGCGMLAAHLTSASSLPWAGDLPEQTARVERRLRSLTEQLVPGWYAGGCKRCGHPCYVVPGLHWITCSGCGVATAARDHVDVVLDEASNWVAPSRRLAEAIVALVDDEHSVRRIHDRIRKWAERGQLTGEWRTTREHVYDDDLDRVVVKDNPTGQPRYRLGDVLDLMNRRHAAAGLHSDEAS